ncbi:MAG: type II secretion system protein GspC [Rudaea sp.]
MLNALSNADQARLSRMAALTLCAVAALVCVWMIVKLVWLVVPQQNDATTSAKPVASAATTPPTSIAKWHLFGNPQNPALTQMSRNAPATTLKLSLRGTLALTDPKQGMAMIADEHNSESAYKVGDNVTDNAKLAEVYTDHVVLTHEGAAETLTLPRTEEHVAAETTIASSRNTAGATPNGKASSVPPNYVPPQMANGALDWSKAQKQLQIDPAKIAQQVHIEPVFQNGKIAGARLSGGGDVAALMSKAGLTPADVVTAINGKPLTSLSDPQQFVDNLKNTTSLQVTVLRDGKPATLTVSLR